MASSSVSPLRIWSRLLLAPVALVALAGSLWIAAQVARYFTFDPRLAFLAERPLLTADRFWSTCFHLHIAGGLVCLLTAPLLLWNGLTGGSRRLHRAVGKLHAVAALGWAGPTGLWLAAFAKGGLAGRIGFGLLGLLFVTTTLLGIRAIRRADPRGHVAWMVRSYALMLSAVTFRLIHPLLHGLGVGADTSYLIATWASLLLAILSGELVAHSLTSNHETLICLARP